MVELRIGVEVKPVMSDATKWIGGEWWVVDNLVCGRENLRVRKERIVVRERERDGVSEFLNVLRLF